MDSKSYRCQCKGGSDYCYFCGGEPKPVCPTMAHLVPVVAFGCAKEALELMPDRCSVWCGNLDMCPHSVASDSASPPPSGATPREVMIEFDRKLAELWGKTDQPYAQAYGWVQSDWKQAIAAPSSALRTEVERLEAELTRCKSALANLMAEAMEADTLKGAPNVEACMALADKIASAFYDFVKAGSTVEDGVRWEAAREALRKELARHSRPVSDATSGHLRLLAPQPAPPRDIVPGKVHCAKCGFSLQRVNLYMLSGTTGAGSEETEPCPNDGTPLLPVTWEQETREGWRFAEQQFDRIRELEIAGAELVACKDLKDEESRLRQRRDVAISRRPEATAQVDAMRDDYNRRKPLAWAALRALLPKGGDRG